MLLAALAGAASHADLERWLATEPAVEDARGVSGGYRLARQLFADVARAAASRPGVLEVERIGETHGGRPIWAFHIEDPRHPPERSVLVLGGIHALEWIASEVAVDVLLWALHRPPAGVRLTVVPLLNPDGRAKVEQDLAGGTRRYRRGNHANVDLNRDFAVNAEPRAVWRHVVPGYYARSDVPLSQPETRALDALARREQYGRAASLHAFGGYLFHPWSGRWRRTEDHERFVALGQAMEQAQGGRAYRTMQLSRYLFFFRAHGSEIDHLYGRYGTLAFLVELSRSGVRPLRPRTWSEYFRWYNPEDATSHRRRGLAALRALILTPPLPGEPTEGGHRVSPRG